MKLPLHHIGRGETGEYVDHVAEHDLWLLADQDCDLAWRAMIDGPVSFLAELRPVRVDDPPSDWGIRSHTLLLDGTGRYVTANSPNVRVTPAVVGSAEHIGCMDPDSRVRLKTWLGLRYDRPAVPQRHVALARALAGELVKKKHRTSAAPIRDVLAQFGDAPDGTAQYRLVAVLPGSPSEDSTVVAETRKWLGEVALSLPTDLGSPLALDAYGDEEVSLAFVEGSFSLDLSKLSWPQSTAGPVGAV